MSKRCGIRECPLFGKREVPYGGNTKGRIICCGESPGYNEERDGKPFIGDAGGLIKRVVRDAGLNWAALFIMNSARCRIIKKEMANKKITAALFHCRRYVEAALHQLKPKCIVLWGDFALKQVMKRSGITKARGRWLWSKEFDCWVMPTFHPAYILRNQSMEQFLLRDMKQVADFARNGYKPLELDEDVTYIDVADLRDVINEGSYVSLDTEDQGLDTYDPNFVMLSVSVSDKDGQGYNVNMYEEAPVDEADFIIQWPRLIEGSRKRALTEVGVKKCNNFDKKVAGLKWLLENSKVKIAMMHGNFDLHALSAFFKRIKEPWALNSYVMDIQAAANVLNENLYKLASLVDLQNMFTNYRSDYNQKFDIAYDKADMLTVPLKDRSLYGCADADVTRRAAMAIKKQLLGFPKLALYYAKVVHPSLMHTLFALEKNGAWIDKKTLPKTTAAVAEMIRGELTDCLKLTPQKVKDRDLHQKKGLKLTRSDFVRDALFSKEGFNLPVIKETKGHEPSIDKKVRKELAERRMSIKARQFLGHYDQWSELHTLWSRYLRGFGKHIKIVDGRVHSSYSLATTVTGRVASSGPNMQNNPKRSKSAKYVRQLISAPKGWLLMMIDESQAELRWAAHLSNAKSMIKVFKENGDIHTNTAKSMVAMTGESWDKISKNAQAKMRLNAKPLNFGMLYLMSAPGLSSYAKYEYGAIMSADEAQEYIDVWFNTYPEIRKYHKNMIEFCRRYQYVESPLGRRRRLPEINSSDKWLKMEAERQCVDQETECLTEFGWKKYNEIKVGDFLWARNWKNGKLRLEPILKMNVYPDYTGEVIFWDRPGFNAVTTSNHRWLVDTLNRKKDVRTIKFCTSSALKTGPYMRIIKSAPSSVKDASYSDNLLKMVGWILTDGGYNTSSATTYIYQSEKKYADNIRQLLSSYEKVKEHINHKEDNIIFTVPLAISKFMRKTFPERILTSLFISTLSKRQAKILIETMLNGDGCREKDKTVFWSITKKRTDAFQYLCTMAGISTTVGEVGPRINKSTHSSIGYKICSKQHKFVRLCKLDKVHSQYGKITNKNFRGLVWCPTVKSGNFVARRNGVTYLTGNSVNHPIQSPSSDIVLMACNELERKEILNPEEILPVLFIHDELVFQVRENADIEYYARAVVKEMENPPLRELGVSLRVPLVADVKIGPNLDQAKKLKL